MKKKLFLLVSIATLCSCGPNDAVQEHIDAEGEAYDPFGKYAKELTVTSVLEFVANSDTRVPTTTTPTNQKFMSIIKDDLNINFQYKWQAPSTQYEQKFNSMLMTGELPDIMKVYATDYYKLVKKGKLADLTEAIKYASDDFKEALFADPEVTESLKVDGKLYAIPHYSDVKTTVPVMYIRQDWLDELELQAPTTPAELTAVAKAFKERKGATSGVALCSGISGTQFSLDRYLNMLGGYPYSWIEDKANPGNLIAGEVAPQVRAGLEYFHDWYEQGLLPKDFASYTTDIVSGDVVSGKTGIIIGPWWQYEFPLSSAIVTNPSKIDWKAYQIPLAEGCGAGIARRQIDYYYVVNKRFNNPEVLVKLLNIYMKYDGTDDAKPEDGYVWSWCPTQYSHPYQIERENTWLNDRLKTDPTASTPADESWSQQAKNIWKVIPDYIKYLADKEKNAIYYNKSNENMMGNIQSRIWENCSWDRINETVKSNKVVYDEFYGEPTETIKKYGSTMSDHIDTTYLKMIVGDTEINDSNWNSFVNKWYSLGGTQATAEVNEWYHNK